MAWQLKLPEIGSEYAWTGIRFKPQQPSGGQLEAGCATANGWISQLPKDVGLRALPVTPQECDIDHTLNINNTTIIIKDDFGYNIIYYNNFIWLIF